MIVGYTMLLSYSNCYLCRILCLILSYITGAPLNFAYLGIFTIKTAVT